MYKLLLLVVFSFISISEGFGFGFLDTNENTNVTLHCNITIEDDFEYPEWRNPSNKKITFLGSSILNNDINLVKEGRIFYSENKKDLILINTEYLDGGVYRCIYYKIEEEYSFYSYDIELDVKEETRIDVETYLNQDVFLPCKINKEKINFDWIKDKSIIISKNKSPDNNTDIVKEKRVSYLNGGIYIKNVKASDEGLYICKYFRSFYVNLKVDKTKYIQKSIINSDVKLICNINNSFVYPEWNINDNYLISRQEGRYINSYLNGKKRVFYSENKRDIIIKNLKESDNGSYICRYDDKIYTIYLTVQIPRRIYINTDLNSMVTLPCILNLKDYDGVYSRWFKIPIYQIKFNSDKNIIESNLLSFIEERSYYDDNRKDLVIKDIKITDNGDYVCFYNSTYRSFITVVVLNVSNIENRKIQKTNTILEVPLYSLAVLNCDIEYDYPEWIGPPNNITYINLYEVDINIDVISMKNDRIEYKVIDHEELGYKRFLTINYILEKDSGLYTCYNDLGDSHTIEIKVINNNN